MAVVFSQWRLWIETSIWIFFKNMYTLFDFLIIRPARVEFKVFLHEIRNFRPDFFFHRKIILAWYKEFSQFFFPEQSLNTTLGLNSRRSYLKYGIVAFFCLILKYTPRVEFKVFLPEREHFHRIFFFPRNICLPEIYFLILKYKPRVEFKLFLHQIWDFAQCF